MEIGQIFMGFFKVEILGQTNSITTSSEMSSELL